MVFGVAAIAIVFAATSASAQGDEPDEALRRPDGLTAGVADQLLGQLAPDQRTLYFVSTRHTTHEIWVEDVDQGRAHLLFDEDADVTWPRVSPDGKSIAYVSFRDSADGQLCVRDLPDGGGRRCLDDPWPALSVEWIDAARAAVLVRSSVDGGLALREVAVGSSLRSKPLLERDLSTPAVSPDGRWLAYVPIERYAPQIGLAFAARAGKNIEVVALEHPGAPAPIEVDLPGRTGQPAFSRDGRFLYFVQFFSDTNHDGVLDANDNGVLLRVPITLGATIRAGQPEQLTDTAWNCQYPAPARGQLVATCAHSGNLDVYTLPLDGEVPSDWSAERIREEIALSTRTSDEQLLYFRRLPKEESVSAQRLVMAHLVRLHLALDEFRAAGYFAERIGRLHDPATRGLARPLATLVEHRRAVRERERGRRSDDFQDEEQKRFDDLEPRPKDAPAVVALAHVVRSEIADGTGDKTRARKELEAAIVDETTPRSIVLFYWARADALYRELDDRDALVRVAERLAENGGLDLEDRLDYARAAVRAITRGLPYDAADAALAGEAAKATQGSELAFAIELGRALLALRGDDPPKAQRDAVIALYERQTRPDRRRAIVYDAVARATRLGADRLVESLSRRYLADTKPGTGEQRRAARLFRRAIIGRANRREAHGKLAEARADFDAVTEKTGSFESLVASIDLRLRAGESVDSIRASTTTLGAPGQRAFATAYLAAAALPALDGSAFEDAAAAALATVRSSWADLKGKRAARALVGEILQQRFLRSGDLQLAERANVHDLVALEQVKKNARYRAMLLGNLGMLHERVGNYRIALSYLEPRDAMPWLDDETSLGVRLAYARSLFHVGRDADAARVADAALASVDRTPALARYAPLAVDRAALYNLSAGRFDRALALYDRLVPAATEPRNRIVLRLTRAAAALGASKPARTLEDVAFVDRALADPRSRDVLGWPHASIDHVMTSYRVIAAGLRAHADRALGDLAAENAALRASHAIWLARFTRTPHREYARALSLVESHLAENAIRRGDAKQASAWIAAAATHADAAHASDRSKIDFPELDVLWLAAELGALDRVPVGFPLADRLARAQTALVQDGRASSRVYARWFEVYSALVR